MVTDVAQYEDFISRVDLMVLMGTYISGTTYSKIYEDYEACHQTLDDFLVSYPFTYGEKPSEDAHLSEILNYIYLGWNDFTEKERYEIAEKLHEQIICGFMQDSINEWIESVPECI